MATFFARENDLSLIELEDILKEALEEEENENNESNE